MGIPADSSALGAGSQIRILLLISLYDHPEGMQEY